jgi:hypothetical protein
MQIAGKSRGCDRADQKGDWHVVEAVRIARLDTLIQRPHSSVLGFLVS